MTDDKKVQNEQLRSGVSFSEAFGEVRTGESGMRLPHWSPEVIILCQRPDENRKMSHPYLYDHSRNGNVPWKETVVEMFSTDWEIYSL